MPDTPDFSNMKLEPLAQGCKDETYKFARHQPSVPDYCFELLCRACRDQDDGALFHVFDIYIPQLESRAKRHPSFLQSCQDYRRFARTALVNYFYAVRGEKFLQKFKTLAEALAYMARCVHSAVLLDIRSNPRLSPIEEEDVASPVPPSDLDLYEVLAYIYNLLPPEDHHLFYLRFELEMKPAEISKAFPQEWKTPRPVTLQLHAIRKLLRVDPFLRSLVGVADETDEERDADDEND